VLTDLGLGPALRALAKRAPVPVEITELPEQRLASPVEAAAYYVVAEAITNVTKYARASHVTVSVRRSRECATVTVSDDGVGGADAAHGSGLRGLADRIEALEGQFYLDSPPEHGTRISAEIPVPRSPAPA
jgi:signal transduction histidine kinase